VDRSLRLATPDYEADDVLVVSEPERIRALADTLRSKLVSLLRERAASTTELAEELGIPKGTIAHHLKVLERAGLVRVVRTRKVRALTESFYGRTARLFVIKSQDDPGAGATLAATSLRQAADEVEAVWDEETTTQALVHGRLTEADARRFVRKLERLVEEFRARETSDGAVYGFVAGFYRTGDRG
jgi:predicted ArsR family transcriptional regulator